MSDVGSLFIVPTPIGNLNDITQRAIDTLKQVALVAAEDTRHTRQLLHALGIEARLLSMHSHNEAQRATQLLEKLQQGLDIALVSDAGTPLISDPGYPLVNRCREAGIRVVPLPGPCAAVTALSGAGLPTDRFAFEGFLPAKPTQRVNALQLLKQEPRTLVFYESPRRVRDTLLSMIEVFGAERQATLAKELTKRFETYIHGPLPRLLGWLDEAEEHSKGEFVLMVAGAEAQADEQMPEQALQLMALLADALPVKQAATITAEVFGLKKKALYQYGLSLRGE